MPCACSGPGQPCCCHWLYRLFHMVFCQTQRERFQPLNSSITVSQGNKRDTLRHPATAKAWQPQHHATMECAGCVPSAKGCLTSAKDCVPSAKGCLTSAGIEQLASCYNPDELRAFPLPQQSAVSCASWLRGGYCLSAPSLTNSKASNAEACVMSPTLAGMDTRE